MRVRWIVEGYEVDGDPLVSEHELVDPDEEELAWMLGLDDVGELYAGGYELTSDMLAFLVQRYGLGLADDPQIYFVASFADE